ncbi:hypothetical protein [Pseudomonas fluorescens]|uniref:hypothetical protein n=1 Tax=Pseudomonas fluorescens TaxID=294 RepID=UPI000A427971
MNRQSPPHLVATPLAAPGSETPAAHPPIWHYGPNIPVVGSTGLGLFGFFVGLLLLLPGYGLVMLVILGLEAMQGVPPSHGTSFTESWLILPLLGTAVLMGVMLAWASSAPRVQAFTFDENQQLLTLTVTHRVRKPIEVRVPFSDIIYICPTWSPCLIAMAISASYARDRRAMCPNIDWLKVVLWKKWSFMQPGCGG